MRHQPVGFLPHVVPAQYPARAAGHVGHVRASLIEDQVPRAQPVPALLKGRDARLRLLISGALVPVERASCSPRTLEQTTAFTTKGPRNNNFTFGYLAPWRRHSCLPRPDSSGRLPDVRQSASRGVGTRQTESPRHVGAVSLFLRRS